MAAVDRARGTDSPRSHQSRESLATPVSRATSKGPESSTVSIASSDHASDDLHRSTDGALDKFSRRKSVDAHSDTSSSQRKRMTRMFKGRSKRRKSTTSQDNLSSVDPNEEVPPLPDVSRLSAKSRNPSDDSLGLHKSVPSSLLTEDSDSDAV